jgi:hypothetical protein
VAGFWKDYLSNPSSGHFDEPLSHILPEDHLPRDPKPVRDSVKWPEDVVFKYFRLDQPQVPKHVAKGHCCHCMCWKFTERNTIKGKANRIQLRRYPLLLEHNIPPYEWDLVNDPDRDGVFKVQSPVFLVPCQVGLILQHPPVLCHPRYETPQWRWEDHWAHAITREECVPYDIVRDPETLRFNVRGRDGNLRTHKCRCGADMVFQEWWSPPGGKLTRGGLGVLQQARERKYRDVMQDAVCGRFNLELVEQMLIEMEKKGF